jgi:hypothetical protein
MSVEDARTMLRQMDVATSRAQGWLRGKDAASRLAAMSSLVGAYPKLQEGRVEARNPLQMLTDALWQRPPIQQVRHSAVQAGLWHIRGRACHCLCPVSVIRYVALSVRQHAHQHLEVGTLARAFCLHMGNSQKSWPCRSWSSWQCRTICSHRFMRRPSTLRPLLPRLPPSPPSTFWTSGTPPVASPSRALLVAILHFVSCLRKSKLAMVSLETPSCHSCIAMRHIGDGTV